MPRSRLMLWVTVFLSVLACDVIAGDSADAHRVLVVGATGR